MADAVDYHALAGRQRGTSGQSADAGRYVRAEAERPEWNGRIDRICVGSSAQAVQRSDGIPRAPPSVVRLGRRTGHRDTVIRFV